jgi:hypothetical protein
MVATQPSKLLPTGNRRAASRCCCCWRRLRRPPAPASHPTRVCAARDKPRRSSTSRLLRHCPTTSEDLNNGHRVAADLTR